MTAPAASLIPLPDPAKALEAAKAARAELDVLISALEKKPDLSSFANKNKVLATQLKLEHALRGPLDTYVSYVLSNGDYTALHTASKLKIYHAIGDDEVTTAEISKKTGVNEGLIHRLLKVLETMNLAREVAPKKWALEEPAKCFYHPVFQGPGGVLCAGWAHTQGHLGEFLLKNPNPTKTFDSTFTMVNGGTPWTYLDEHPEAAASFSIAMESLSLVDDCVPLFSQILEKSGRTTGKLIDIGAGSGHICNRLATYMPDLHFEIQDVHRHQFNAAQATLPDSLKSRISFKEHSFFSPQEPDSAAVAYFLRQVLHDWADEDAIKIIRTMVPALEANPKATLFINEMLIRDFGECETALDEQDARRYDMCMMVYLNAKERDRAAWEKLFKMADERFEVVNVIRQEKPGSSMAFLEFKLNV